MFKNKFVPSPFKGDFLTKYLKMKPTKLEILESIDIRLLENNIKIKLVKVNKSIM